MHNLVRKSEKKSHLRELSIYRRIILKWILKEMGHEDFSWINLAQERNQFWALVNMLHKRWSNS
jgi:hypothetical protein